MGFLDNFNNNVAVFSASEVASPKTVAVSDKDNSQNYNKVSRDKLENVYLTDPQSFNTINKSKQLIMQAGYEMRAEKKGVQSKYDEFFDNIGNIGMQMNLSQLFSYIYHDKFLYGCAYVERIYDTTGNTILDLKMIDPKLMDFARDKNGIIVVDRNQNPVGYTMDVGSRVKDKGDKIPTYGLSGDVMLEGTQIFFLSFRIAYFRMFSYGNRFESVGIIEPAIKDIDRKHKIETATVNSIYNTAAYPIIAYVGDNQRAASQSLMNSTLDAMQNLNYSRYMVFQHPTKLETLEVKHSEQVDNTLRYFRANQSAASGMALGFSIGTGEAINRSTLSTQQRMLDISLDSEARNTAEEFNVQILDVLYRVNGYASKAKVIWGDVAAEDKSDKVRRLLDSVNAGVISPEEARTYILKSEDILENKESFIKHNKTLNTNKEKKLNDKNTDESKEYDEDESKEEDN